MRKKKCGVKREVLKGDDPPRKTGVLRKSALHLRKRSKLPTGTKKKKREV